MSKQSITLPGPVRSIALLLLLIVATLGFNTIRFSSVQVTEEPAAALALDESAVLKRLTEVIRHKTISYQDPERWDDRPFLELHEYLRQQFPTVHSAAELETIGQYSLLYRIPGKDTSLKPILLMAHMDVVPIEDNTRGQWLQPPFSGTVIDGELFGRGTIDDKASMVAILEAAEWLLSSTFTPDRDIYLFFGHDEELGGNRGAIPAVRKLEADGIFFDFVLDEGMGIAEGLGNLEVPAAIIGIAEKGTVTLELTATAAGGHSSQPTSDSAVEALARALVALQDNPIPARLAGATELMFDTLTREMGWSKRLLFANRWLTEPVLVRALSSSEAIQPMLQTTASLTMFNAGIKANVLPTKATAIVNFRLLPGDSIESVTAHLRQVIDNPAISIEAQGAIVSQPSSISDVTSTSYQLLQTTIRQVFPEALVAPGLVMGGTDSRHFATISDNVYRFVPYRVGRHNIASIHGVNERIATADYFGMIQFYVQLMRSTQA